MIRSMEEEKEEFCANCLHGDSFHLPDCEAPDCECTHFIEEE